MELVKFYPEQSCRGSETQELIGIEALENGEEKRDHQGNIPSNPWRGELHLLVGSFDARIKLHAAVFKRQRAVWRRPSISLNEPVSRTRQ